MYLQNASMKVTHFIRNGFDTVKRPVAVGVVILIIYLVSIVTNLLNILFIISDKRLHKPMYILICNLAIVDIMYISSAGPTMVGLLVAGVNTISYLECLIQMFVFHLGGVMERFALAIMAFDRLVAIIYPFQYYSYLKNTRILLYTYILWVVACGFVVVLPATVAPLPHCYSSLRYSFCDYAAVVRTTCVDPTYFFNIGAVIYSFLLFLTFIFICLSYCVILIFAKLSSSNDKKKIGSTLVSHLICVICHYCPAFVIIVLTRLGVVLTLEERQGLLIANILGPSVVNPFVYCLRTKEIKNKIYMIFKKLQIFR
ncbi:putative olfactory receptor 10D4 [Pelmatolapia mariae]|uniref:putative olfactory receptor 10D4 n=1 Tax=Pelmatolapia mariae TaxID=158779 RepID=UPI002FE5A893